ncbi:hypothetical protein HMPREF0693_1963 [Proteus mirabilis ATCC 29906]|nr:hypothetical protein HMPREF0693_1963 [Proteus mirabilis ATCC 29906]
MLRLGVNLYLFLTGSYTNILCVDFTCLFDKKRILFSLYNL